MANDSVFGLVCAGGGAHGAYQVGVLKFIHEKFCNGDQSPFQIFTGCSCGSLNTSFYGAQSYDAKKSRLWLEELWLNFHIPSYHGNMLKNAAGLFFRELRKPKEKRSSTWSLLDPQPMYDVIQKGFLRKSLDKALSDETTKGIGIVTTELVSGRCCWFLEGANAKSWNLFHSIARTDRLVSSHVAASCSVPIFLPPVKVGDRYFLDGSVSLERPLSAAVAMGATRILSIACNKPFPDELPTYSPAFQPRISNVIRMLVNRLSFDSAQAEATQIRTLNQFYDFISRKMLKLGKDEVPLPLFHEAHMPSHYNPIEVYQIHPSRRIKQTPVDADYGHGEKVKRGNTRFMFHRRFIQQLIELGYQDAAAQEEELKKFFTVKKNSGRWETLRFGKKPTL